MENNQNGVAVPQETAKQKVSTLTNRVAAVGLTLLATGAAMAAEDYTINVGTIAVTGLATAAAGIFAVKASPSMMMWGYRKILGFIGR